MPKVVGPGTDVQQDIAPEPLLNGASEMEYVTVFNPLSDDFQVKVAQSIPVNVPFQIHKDNSGKTSFLSNTENDVKQIYGLGLKNPDHQAKKYIYNDTVIPSGGVKRFRGDTAQVAVRQLVNEIMQREGKKRFIADPTARKEIEELVIKDRGYVQDIMEGNIKTHTQVVDEAINKSNEVNNDVEFPGIINQKTSPADNEGTGSAGNDPTPSQERISDDKSKSTISKTTK